MGTLRGGCSRCTANSPRGDRFGPGAWAGPFSTLSCCGVPGCSACWCDGAGLCWGCDAGAPGDPVKDGSGSCCCCIGVPGAAAATGCCGGCSAGPLAPGACPCLGAPLASFWGPWCSAGACDGVSAPGAICGRRCRGGGEESGMPAMGAGAGALRSPGFSWPGGAATSGCGRSLPSPPACSTLCSSMASRIC